MTVSEKGEWFSKGDQVCSDDFTHDVILTINGDFESREQKDEYAAEIAKRLNAYYPKS